MEALRRAGYLRTAKPDCCEKTEADWFTWRASSRTGWATLLISSHSKRQPRKTWRDTRWELHTSSRTRFSQHGQPMNRNLQMWNIYCCIWSSQWLTDGTSLAPTHKTDKCLCPDSKCEMLPHEEWQDARQVRHLTASLWRPISWAAVQTTASADSAAFSAQRTAAVIQNAFCLSHHAFSFQKQSTFWLYASAVWWVIPVLSEKHRHCERTWERQWAETQSSSHGLSWITKKTSGCFFWIHAWKPYGF